MSFAAGAFVTVVANGGSIIAAAMANPYGVVAYENGNAGGAGAQGAISVGGRLRRAGNGEIGVTFLRLVSQVSAALAVKQAAATAVIGATDCGHLTTAQTGTADLCNLPSNFGPGAGNWTAADRARMDVFVRFVPDANAAGAGSVVHFGTTIVAGDAQFAFKNCSLGISGVIEIDLRYRHTIEG